MLRWCTRRTVKHTIIYLLNKNNIKKKSYCRFIMINPWWVESQEKRISHNNIMYSGIDKFLNLQILIIIMLITKLPIYMALCVVNIRCTI